MAEVNYWGQIAVTAVGGTGTLALNAVELIFKKLLVWGGDPLANIFVGLACIPFTINVFRFIEDIVPPLLVLFVVTLSSVVLQLGRVFQTRAAPRKKNFLVAGSWIALGFLGLGGFVGVIPVEIRLLGIVAITGFLLFVRKVNPVAGFTPAAAVFCSSD